MKILYLECNMGAAGDMLMGALLDVFPAKEDFLQRLNAAGIPDVSVKAETSVKCGIYGTHVRVDIKGQEEVGEDVALEHRHGFPHDHREEGHGHHDQDPAACREPRIHPARPRAPSEEPHAHPHVRQGAAAHRHAGIREILEIIDSLRVPPGVKEDAKGVYRLIAEAESKVHGKPVAEVHFHEVGMMDALADLVGCILLLRELNVEKVIVSPVNVGFGQVKCAHGILPVPAPATALLLAGVPCYAGNVEGELCTPTGAALLRYFADSYSRLPQMKVEKIGYGMGKKDFPAANCVRAILGEAVPGQDGAVAEPGEAVPVWNEVTELCCNLDDMTPEALGYAMEVFLNEGALDVYTAAIGMKKSRPGTLLTILCRTRDESRMTQLLFRHTTTLGIRTRRCGRKLLDRTQRKAENSYGSVRIKEASGYGVKREKMEYEDLKAVADRHKLSFYEAADLFREL
ncbi:MAG: nickel pincer cofactor biosynthesis protein LarC [Clostridium sp.]|nr:nickel pincer cofactor biosynthesis protein LarC [Clostridium sp.]